MSPQAGSVLGISFDGLSVSGIVNEFLHVASCFHSRGYRVLLDLGGEIALTESAVLDAVPLPSWVVRVRALGNQVPSGYDPERVRTVRSSVIAGLPVRELESEVTEVVARLVEAYLDTFRRHEVRFLVVENGTLPENPLITEALVEAIRMHGSRNGLGKFVLWRDHDLMWSVEPHLYGSFPYPGVRKPEASPYIHYAVCTDWMRRRMKAWARDPHYQVIPNRFYSVQLPRPEILPLRTRFGIPQEAILIARCTRVMPQKSIARDLYLIGELERRLKASDDPRKVYLFVTGPTSEDPVEFDRLRQLAKSLSLHERVIWGNGLLPFNSFLTASTDSDRHSVRDLLAEADLSSFLTTYNYEGFGNPPGEAMASDIPYTATTYELYHEVYGSKGAVAPLLAIDRNSQPDEPLPELYMSWLLQLISDRQYRAQVTTHNRAVCKEYFSLGVLDRQLGRLFPTAFEETAES